MDGSFMVGRLAERISTQLAGGQQIDRTGLVIGNTACRLKVRPLSRNADRLSSASWRHPACHAPGSHRTGLTASNPEAAARIFSHLSEGRRPMR